MVQIFIGMLLFTVFAFGGLIADLGFVRLAQRHMNHATDAAALEGMRLVDATSDLERRQAARARLRAHFDDDFDSTVDDSYQYGAGPLVRLEGGQGALGANKQVIVEPSIVYEPAPELNLPNVVYGDFVSGFYDDEDLAHAESTGYARSDFDVVPAAGRRQAFLVRMRRTNDDQGLDQQAGISSAGPTLPYLFARGSLLAAQPRAEGVTVRSTSVAQARNVTLAGAAQPAFGLEGTAPFGIELDWWNGVDPALPASLSFRARPRLGNGGGGPPLPPLGRRPGWWQGPWRGSRFFNGREEPEAVFANRSAEPGRQSWSIGDDIRNDPAFDEDRVLAQLGNPLSPTYTPRLFLVPIYEGDYRILAGTRPPATPPFTPTAKNRMNPRVVGFASILLYGARLEVDNRDRPGEPDRPDPARVVLVFRKLGGLVWPANVSAVQTPGLAGLPDHLSSQLTQLNASIDAPAQAAALGR